MFKLTTLMYSKFALGLFALNMGLIYLAQTKNNVCKTFEDYYSNRDNNKNCYYNPDADLTVPEIISKKGYCVETHEVTTEDGYVLTLFRIPHGQNKIDQDKGPILIQHGLVSNSVTFVNIGDKSLGFMLANAGYDVWLGNFRGTMYSKNHTNLATDDPRFWNFNIDDYGLLDTKAFVDFIYNATEREMVVIGYSIGAVSSYMYGVTYPQEAVQKIKIIISMAPTVFTNNMRSTMKYFFWFWKYIEPITTTFTNGEMHMRGTWQSEMRKYLCLPFPFQMKGCQIMDMLQWGIDYKQSDPETLPITMMQNSDALSTKLVSHLVQFYEKGKFERFDYGFEKNLQVYGQTEPPPYNLSKLTVPTYIIRGENDFIATKEDVQRLHEELPKETNPYDIYVIEYENFNHGDFVSAKDVANLLYKHIINFLDQL